MLKAIIRYIFIVTVVCLTLHSCKRDDETTAQPGDTGTNTPTSKIKLLTTDRWKIVGQRLMFHAINATGGSYFTVAFNNHHNENELRWYTWFQTNVNWIGHNEMTIDKNDKATSVDVSDIDAKGGEFKIVNNNTIWKVNRSLDDAKVIHVFKNDKIHPNDNTRDGKSNIDQLISSSDGIFTYSTSLTSNDVSHFNVGTEVWKKNTFGGNNFFPIRYNNSTYVIAFTNYPDASLIRLLKESDTRNESPIPGLPNTKNISYAMDIIKDIQLKYTGNLIHYSRYGDNVFLALNNFRGVGRVGVFKWNLANQTVDLLHEFATTSSSDVTKYGTNAPYLHAIWDIDNVGNFYVVERRKESNKSKLSIRQYKVTGGTEILLKEEDLILATQINAIKFFNGKLYAAISYNELLPDDNPDDFNFKYNFHLQIISPK